MINERKKTIYISGSLTNLTAPQTVKGFYESLGNICSELDFSPYIPHLNTDPEVHTSITPKEVFLTDKKIVLSSSLVIAYLGHLSFGVGMELAYADTKNIPIILLCPENNRISRFVLGIPSIVSEIRFSDFSNAQTQLREILSDWKKSKY